MLIAYQPARWNSQNCSGGPIAISYAGSPFRFLGILFKPKVQSLPRAEVARSSQNFPSLNRRLAIVQATAYDVNGLYGVHEMTFPLSMSSFYFFIADSRGVMLPRPLPVRCGGPTRLHPTPRWVIIKCQRRRTKRHHLLDPRKLSPSRGRTLQLPSRCPHPVAIHG